MMDLERAFEVLGVEPTATAQEVRDSYRDLVKVWHPDRFASDPVLQRKAQEKLKDINEAYDAVRAFLAGARGSARGQKRSPRSQHNSSAASHQEAEGTKRQRPDSQAHGRPLDIKQLLKRICPPILISLWFVVQLLELWGGRAGGPSSSNKGLSNVEQEELDMKKEEIQVLGHTLDADERQSIKSVCLLAKQQGPDAYKQCRQKHLEQLSAGPRQELSGLDAHTRRSIESACLRAKLLEGPAAYNQCRIANAWPRPTLKELEELDAIMAEQSKGTATAPPAADKNQLGALGEGSR